MFINILAAVVAATSVTPPGTLIELNAGLTVEGKKVCHDAKSYVAVVAKPHSFIGIPSAASIKTYSGKQVAFKIGDVKMEGILLLDGRVLSNGIVHNPWNF